MSYWVRADVGDAGGDSYTWQDVFVEGSNTAKAYNIRLSKEINSAGSLSFTIAPNHPLYNAIYILGTTIYANANGAMFLGRVMSIQTDMYKSKIINCEGALSWLSDIIARPHLWYDYLGETKEERSAYPYEYVQWIYSQHYERASAKRHITIYADYNNLWDSEKQGDIYISKRIIKGNEDYKPCLKALTDLTNLDENAAIIPDYSGTECGINIVNIATYKADEQSVTTINFQGGNANLVHVDVDITGDDIYTSVVPLGKDKLILNGDTDYVVGGLTTMYGVIEKVSDYDTAESELDLYDRASAELTRISNKVKALTIQAVGLSVDLGSKVTVIDNIHGINGDYIVTALNINIDNLGQSTYTVFPCGSGYAGRTSVTLTDIAKNGGQKYQNSTTFSSGESPTNLIQEEDTHIKAVGQRWTTHYVATETETDVGEYSLSIYRTENSS